MIITDIKFDLSLIDSQGITIAAVGYIIVFSALIILFFVFRLLPQLLKISQNRRLKNGVKGMAQTEEEVTGDLTAAISMALFLHSEEKHDVESNVLTIRKVSRRYSPWNVNKF